MTIDSILGSTAAGQAARKPSASRDPSSKVVAQKGKFRHNRVIEDEGDIDDQIADKLAMIDRFVADHPGQPVSDLIRSLFPDLSTGPVAEPTPGGPVVPDRAPALWRVDREPKQSVFDFIRQHYGPYLGKGMRRADLKRLDPALYQAMNQRLVTESMPEDIDLPTRKQFNDRWVERVQSGEEAPPVMAEAADRFRAAARTRNKQADSSTGTVSRQ